MIIKVLKKTKRLMKTNHRGILLDYNGNYRKSICLAGTRRSGSTWIAEVINYRNDYRYMFEPFNREEVDLWSKFKDVQYIRPDDFSKEYHRIALTILSGKLRSEWVDQFNKKLIVRERLIKDVRVNLLLKWMYTHFPGLPIILLLRHPCAVANSVLQLNAADPLNFDGREFDAFLTQEELFEDYLYPFEREIRKAKTAFEKQIFTWCIEYYVPVKQFKDGQIHMMFYEDCCENPQREVERLYQFLGKRFDERVFSSLKKPSAMSRKESAICTGGGLIDSWRKHISEDQVKRAVEILSIFGLDKIYGQDSRPNTENACEILKANV